MSDGSLVLVEDLRAALGLAVIISCIAEVGDGIFGFQLQHLRAGALIASERFRELAV